MGKKVRRGLATKVTVGLVSSPKEPIGAYDDTDALVEQNYPGVIKAKYTHDLTGVETGLSYTHTVGGVESDLLGAPNRSTTTAGSEFFKAFEASECLGG